MEENTKGVARGSVGFGSSYRKGTQHDLKERSENWRQCWAAKSG